MKAAVLYEFKGIEKVYLDEIPTPEPKAHEVQIKIHYAGVNPVDWKIAEGMLKKRSDYRFPITLGWDCSGTISALGSKVKSFKVGDPVFAFIYDGQLIHHGTYAEYTCCNASYVAHKPPPLPYELAAALPCAALTAWQAIHEHMHLKKDHKILIHAGAGGVGGFAIQFAKQKGAHVLATTSSSNFDYLKELGADEIIDYKKAPFDHQILQRHPEKLDIVFDTVGGDTLDKSLFLLKKGGQLVTIAGVVDQRIATDLGITSNWFMLSANASQLEKIAQLIVDKKLKTPPIQIFNLDEFESALHLSRERHVQGKLVLQIIES